MNRSEENKSLHIPAAVPTMNKKDFESDQDVRWCPGCGDYSILSQTQRILPELGIPKEQLVFISGIAVSTLFLSLNSGPSASASLVTSPCAAVVGSRSPTFSASNQNCEEGSSFSYLDDIILHVPDSRSSDNLTSFAIGFLVNPGLQSASAVDW